MFRYSDSVSAQKLRAAGCFRIRIPGANDHMGDPIFQDGVRTGRGPSLMTAGLQRHIHDGAGRILGTGGQCIALRVGAAAAAVIPLADDAPVFYDHGAHHGIRVRLAKPQPGKTDGAAHILFFQHSFPSVYSNRNCVK